MNKLNRELNMFTREDQVKLNEDYKGLTAYICDFNLVKNNMLKIKEIKDKTNIKVIIALKGSSFPATWDICKDYVDGATASGLYENKLANEFCNLKENLEVHTFSPSFTDDEIDEILNNSKHIVFNSLTQLSKYKQKAMEKGVSISLRLNPEYSTVEVDLYNPCKMYSRFGVTKSVLDEYLKTNPNILDGIGFHIHAMCMNKGNEVRALLKEIEKFPLASATHINLGGGHDITLGDYNTEAFISAVNDFKEKWNITEFYIEPGYGILANTGSLIGTVVDIVNNGMNIAILDISASCHHPDIIEYGFRPPVRNENEKGKFTYMFSSNTCLSGDDFGVYNFDYELEIGDKIVFDDSISYTMVKNTTFNGIKLPSLGVKDFDGKIKIIKEFGYDDFRNKLG